MIRVAVTGLGAVTALGPDLAALERGLREGRSGVRDVTLFDTTGFRTQLGAQAPDPTPPVDEALLANVSRPDRFGLQAAFEAVRSAGLEPGDLDRAALIFGTGTGGAAITEAYHTLQRGQTELPPAAMLVPHQPASVTDLTARHLGIHGPRTTIMTACSSSATAVGYAADRIRLGHVKVALAGGAEGMCRLTYAGFNCLRATAPDACRPFDAERRGLNLGEGAAVLVLEEYEHARARGATIYAIFAGYGITADAHHMTAPHPEGDGAARAMREALKDADLSTDAVGYINAHGTATPHNDAAETAAIKSVFGPRAPSVPVSSIKSMVGHTLGAAGAIEAIASVLALYRGFLPPTVNLRTPDPAFGLDFIPGAARTLEVDVVLSNSFAFGGNNTALAFRRA
ncbi:MAG TPA: beta-ketoacyl-[acyl-carrier-protein] synthase family protein [Kofleriaceae bacterium]|nr:beta-ketoacyl-[acyl-carrier-protein] synthase family protein [Kofleriaceae bacterium]